MSDERINEIFNKGFSDTIQNYKNHINNDFENIFKIYKGDCLDFPAKYPLASPIEDLFFIAFYFKAKQLEINNEYYLFYFERQLTRDIKKVKEINESVLKSMQNPIINNNFISFYPQFEINKYRVDFLVYFSMAFYDQKKDDISIFHNPIIIECDGHAYHDNKIQINKDKQKDRFFQTRDYKIFRFTGSELYKNPFKCIDFLFDYFKRLENIETEKYFGFSDWLIKDE